jgi:hypothetical protein
MKTVHPNLDLHMLEALVQAYSPAVVALLAIGVAWQIAWRVADHFARSR